MADKIRDLRDKYFQVDDEYLNGYAKLCGIQATGVYLSLCRHANKQQQCFPSKKLVANELAISERGVYSAVKELEKWNIIKVEEQGRKENGSFKNKLYTLLDKKYWKNKPQAINADGKIEHQPQANDDISRRQDVPNKETHIKETHIKESNASVAVGIQHLIELFKEVNPTYKRLYSNTTQRAALERLVKEFGEEELKKVLEVLPKINKIPYMVVSTTPYELEVNWGKIKAKMEQHFQKVADKKNKYVKII